MKRGSEKGNEDDASTESPIQFLKTRRNAKKRALRRRRNSLRFLLPSESKQPMATASSSTTSTDPKLDLIKQIRTHKVAIAELGNLSSLRIVYLKNGNLFFRTTIQKATSSKEKQLDMAKVKLEKLNSQ